MGLNSTILVAHDSVHKTIFGNILQHEYNSAFILVLQQPNYENTRQTLSQNLIGSRIELSHHDSAARTIGDKMADSIIRNDSNFRKIFSKKFNLYIITEDLTYGPLDLNEYYIKRSELGVPKGLYLKI